MVVEEVICELVSCQISLFYKEFTGKNDFSGSFRRSAALESRRFLRLIASNSLRAEQGIQLFPVSAYGTDLRL
jgi:hypothetical protein